MCDPLDIGGSLGAFVMGTEEQQKRLPRATKNLKLGEWPVYTDIISGKAPGSTTEGTGSYTTESSSSSTRLTACMNTLPTPSWPASWAKRYCSMASA